MVMSKSESRFVKNLVDALVNVRKLHAKDDHGYCEYCYTYMGTASFYPCPTMKALGVEPE